ncbi:NlpC/P60 family protein [Evansella sp. AB-P1]|uniref:coiled-coil domain-containing protein n=1 Tax=Evansella sp. AB-P1 TaxID=3037653 RepID=UPI00241CE75E|nr:C40 family peptidase [Evansella sp. AB-P1]MDG5788960.1 NlpC/P60 family protein [Evansella sp. AB-P1]
MLKKGIVVKGILIVGLLSSLTVPTAFAETTNDLQNQQSQIQEERSTIQSELSEVEQEIASVLDELDQLTEQIERVNQAMKDNEEIIKETEENIEAANEEVEILQEDITDLEVDIDARLDLLKERANSFQKSGGTLSYIEVILGSKSFGDLIERVFAITQIAKADADFIERLETNKAELQKKQDSVEKKLTELNEMKTELVGMQHHLEDQIEQNEELKKELKDKEEQNEELISSLLEQDNELAARESEIRNRIERERERARQTETRNQTTSTSSTSTNNRQVAIPNGTVNDVINAGKKYIGNSVYVFAGGRTSYDIQNGRFDCSGFVRWAFSQVGVSLGYSTDSMTTAGRQVPASEMKPGDLVFFNTYKTDGHVGIYIGGGKFIGSQSNTGVAIADMTRGYWRDHFNGRVVRVIE